MGCDANGRMLVIIITKIIITVIQKWLIFQLFPPDNFSYCDQYIYIYIYIIVINCMTEALSTKNRTVLNGSCAAVRRKVGITSSYHAKWKFMLTKFSTLVSQEIVSDQWRKNRQYEEMVIMMIMCTGMILGLCPANERRRYFVTTSLTGWAPT